MSVYFFFIGSMLRLIIYMFVYLIFIIVVFGVIFISYIVFVKLGSFWVGECKVFK